MGLSEDLVAEAKERTAGDAAIHEIAEVARTRLEKESQERTRCLEEHGRRVVDLTDHIQNEKTSRALNHSTLEQQLSNATRNITAVKSDSAKEFEGVRNRLQKFEEKLGKFVVDILQEIEETKNVNAEKHGGHERALKDLTTAFGSHVSNTTKKQSDQHETILSLKDAISQETVMRAKERSSLASDLNQTREKLEKDGALRSNQL